jgi:nickel-dependent lactate racemase
LRSFRGSNERAHCTVCNIFFLFFGHDPISFSSSTDKRKRLRFFKTGQTASLHRRLCSTGGRAHHGLQTQASRTDVLGEKTMHRRSSVAHKPLSAAACGCRTPERSLGCCNGPWPVTINNLFFLFSFSISFELFLMFLFAVYSNPDIF